jgi:hypothetical protein
MEATSAGLQVIQTTHAVFLIVSISKQMQGWCLETCHDRLLPNHYPATADYHLPVPFDATGLTSAVDTAL